MDCLQRGNMFIAAIPGVAHQNSQGITARSVIGQGIQRRIHTGREVEQLARDARMAVSEPAEIAAGGENAPYPPLRHAAQRIEQAKLQAGGVFVQIRPPDMPVKLRRADAAAQQRQPQPGIELAVEEKALLAVGFRGSNHCLRQRFLPRIAGDVQRRIPITHAGLITDDHKSPGLRVGGQFVVKEPQYGLVMMRDIRSQYMYQCCHARLRQSKNTPLQRAK